MNTIELIKKICKDRGIAISKLERDCGFSNGYISGIKRGSIRGDRLQIIADYLELSVDYLLKPDKSRADLFGGLSEIANISQEEKDLIESFRLLNDEGKLQLKRQLGYLLNDELFTLTEHERREVNSVS